LASTHIFYPFAIETDSLYMAWDGHELTQLTGRRITTITEDTRKTTFLFQRLSMAIQRGNAVSFHNTMVTEQIAVATIILYVSPNFPACGWALKIIIPVIIIIIKICIAPYKVVTPEAPIRPTVC